MVPNQWKVFEKNYCEVLRVYLTSNRRGRLTSRTARKIGKEAVALGLCAIDLARTHDGALRRLGHISSGEEDGTPASSAAFFYIEALVPFEVSRKVEQTKYQRNEKTLKWQLQREIKSYEKLLAESEREKARARQLTHQFFLAQEEERKEISRDLHDEIAQVLAGINVRLAALKKMAQKGVYDIGERVDETQKLVEQSVEAVHRFAVRLRPSLLDDLGLVPSIRSYIKDISERKDINIRFKAGKDVEVLDNLQRTALYRVTQEALTNVIRHSRAENVNVSLQKLSTGIRLKIHDDGKGFDPKRILNSMSHRRLGILGMRERVEMLGGKFSIVSTSAKGTTVTANMLLSLAPNGNKL